MDITQIVDLVSSTGFPIAMCCILVWYIKDRDEKLQGSFDKMTEAFIEFKQMINDIVKGEE